MRQFNSYVWWLFTTVTFATMGLISCQSNVNNLSSQFEVKTDREDAQFSVITDGNTGTVDILSESGIGRGQVDLVSGQWPERLILRFYMSGLEGMQFHYGDVTVSVSVNSSGQVIQSVTINEEKQRPISQESRYWMPVHIVASNEAAAAVPLADGVI